MSEFLIPPPSIVVAQHPTPELPLIVECLIVMDPRLLTPPPDPKLPFRPKESETVHELPLIVELVIVSEPPESFNIPPPELVA